MKVVRRWLFTVAIAAVLSSCASGPEPVEKPEPVEVPVSGNVEEAKAAADEARIKAEDAKAPRAAAEAFDSAQAIYDQAADAEKSGDTPGAIEKYDLAAAGFLKAADDANAAREAALAAIADVEKAISETEQKADEALQAVQEDQ